MNIVKNIIVTEENISDIMTTAFEGGINYWCDKVTIINNPANKNYASDVIAYGGELKLISNGAEFNFTRNMVLKGMEKAMEHFKYDSLEKMIEEHDVVTADIVVQFATFREIIFG